MYAFVNSLRALFYIFGVFTFPVLSHFELSHAHARNWASAASDLEGTLWCKQVGSRCADDVGRVRTGCPGVDVGAAGKVAGLQAVAAVM